MYQKYEDVKLENKFAPVALTIPLITDFSEATVKKVKGATSKLKSSLPVIYCMYVFSIVMGKLMPTALNMPMLSNGSKNYSLAFSNTPGFLKKMKFGEVDTER